MFKKLFFMSVMILDLNFLCGMHVMDGKNGCAIEERRLQLNKTEQRWEEEAKQPCCSRQAEQTCLMAVSNFFLLACLLYQNNGECSVPTILSFAGGIYGCWAAREEMIKRDKYLNSLNLKKPEKNSLNLKKPEEIV